MARVSSINFHTKEISAKIVYYGPGLCGKTTSLQKIYSAIPEERKPKIVSLATEVDRTIFFDFMPLTAYRIRDFTVRLQLYTVPGQVFYNATRKLVLNGVDGIVFVADSQRAMQDSNLESLQNLEENLGELGLELERVPVVIQYNKRDLEDIFSFEQMQEQYNPRGFPAFNTTATTGEGLFEALKTISQLVVNDLVRKGLGKQLREQGTPRGPAAAFDAARSNKSAPSTPEAGNKPPSRAAPEGQPVSEPQASTPAAAPPGGAIGASVAEAVSQATAPEKPTGHQVPLWPSAEVTRWGDQVLAALAERRWNDAVQAVYGLLNAQAQQWAASQQQHAGDSLTGFLLAKGVPSERYRAFARSVSQQQQGLSLGQGEAVNALILALEAVW